MTKEERKTLLAAEKACVEDLRKGLAGEPRGSGPRWDAMTLLAVEVTLLRDHFNA